MLIRIIFFLFSFSAFPLLAQFGTSSLFQESEMDDQEVDSLQFVERLTYGGNGSAGFQDNSYAINISPQIGYRLTNQITFGVQIPYNLLHDDYYEYRYSSVGISPFIRARVLRILFGQAEVEGLYIKRRIYFGQPNEIQVFDFVPGILFGGGVCLASGGNYFTSLGVMFNVLDATEPRPYNNPQFRLGFHYRF